jgi:hypothetical protein
MKLKKINEEYFLIDNAKPIASTQKNLGLLLIKNIQLIELWKNLDIDIEQLSKDEYKGKEMYITYDAHVSGFIAGYNKSLENNKDKKFTLEDIQKALSYGYHTAKDEEKGIKSSGYGSRFLETLENKQTEWNVEVEMGIYPHPNHEFIDDGKTHPLETITKPLVKDGYINILSIN